MSQSEPSPAPHQSRVGGWGERGKAPARVGYVVKVYPRFSETFIVTELLAREAAGADLRVFSLRPTSDPRFHPEISAVRAPVEHLEKPHKLSDGWSLMAAAQAELPWFGERFAGLLPFLTRIEVTDALQGVDLALRARRHGLEHLHAHFASSSARVAYIASVLTGIPFSVTTHAKDIFHTGVDPEVLGEMLAGAGTIIAISRYNRRYLLERYPHVGDRVQLVRNGIDLARFEYRPPPAPGEVLRVAAVGRLVEKKGFGGLVSAAALARSRGTALEVRIAGDGELRGALAAQIEGAGLCDVVTLLGPQGQDEVRSLLRWADALVAPCVVGSDGNADGMPTVLLEAMAMGVPCVSTAVTGIPEAIHSAGTAGPSTGLLLAPGDVEGVASALADLARPDFPRDAMARAARDLIESEFDVRTQARRLAEVTSEPVSTLTGAGV